MWARTLETQVNKMVFFLMIQIQSPPFMNLYPIKFTMNRTCLPGIAMVKYQACTVTVRFMRKSLRDKFS